MYACVGSSKSSICELEGRILSYELQCLTKTLSSIARRLLFEYPEIYLNKGKACKARVNEWISNQI